MNAPSGPHLRQNSVIDRYTSLRALGDVLHLVLRPGILIATLLLVALVFRMLLGQSTGWLGVTWIGLGLVATLVTWRSVGVGLPLLPLLGLQHFALYAIPLLNRNKTILSYPEAMLDRAGLEVFVFLLSASLAWRVALQLAQPAPPMAFALKIFEVHGNKVLGRVGLGLVAGSFVYEILNSFDLVGVLMSFLPNGTGSIVTALVSAAGMSGYFLTALFVASGEAKPQVRTAFWVVLTVHLLLLAASILLFTVVNLIGAVVIGLFWGGGRMPRAFILVCCAGLAFLNAGKFEMRDRYWTEGSGSAAVPLQRLPAYYLEWAGYSMENLLGKGESANGERAEKHTMLARIDAMQNLLYVADAVENGHAGTLDGATYAIIPPLLIPRIFWEDKPRTHEGQIMLNEHFGRQSREDSFSTYIAWGLLPEAYGNFGSMWGGVILGTALGLIFGWIELLTVNKPLLSLEGMLAFAMFISFAASYEMVASVLVTSMFQSLVVIALACLPFVQRSLMIRPAEAA